jgi:pyridoxal phosphate enzyme (YggS family)
MDFLGLAESLVQVRETIAERQARAGWTHPVSIVAVTKTHGPDAVRAALAAGLSKVGENRVQEALAKQQVLADCPVEWHLIGSLQRKKARQVVGRFGLIHSVDRLELAQEIHKRADPGTRQAVLVQVNCSDEEQKGGVLPIDLEALLEAMVELDRLDVRGLMTMAALTRDEGNQRRAFARLRQLRDESTDAGFDLPELSMGMSGDYPIAVEEGATMLRLGTVLFGERHK